MRRRNAALLGRSITPLAILAVGALTFQASHAAFTATTNNPSNAWTAGRLTLTDDDSGTAMFTVSAMKPGDTGTKCIVVSSGATQSSLTTQAVKLYATSAATATNSLDTYLNLTIDEGTGSTFSASSCAGFSLGANLFTGTLSGFTTARTNYANGVASSFAPTGPSQSKVFRFVWTLQSGTPDSAQAGTAGTGFTFEEQA